MSNNPSGLNQKPKPQKHYRSLSEIEADISRAHKQRQIWHEMAREREEQSQTLIRTGDAYSVELGNDLKKQAIYLRDKIKRIDEVRLVKLKRAHAAFQTRLLPGLEDDASVVLENLQD